MKKQMPGTWVEIFVARRQGVRIEEHRQDWLCHKDYGID
jgi:hypothetical protein